MMEKGGVKDKTFLNAAIDAVPDLSERYAMAADQAGNTEAAEILRRVPAYGARTFREALQSFRALHFCLWPSFNYHNTLGRFDQYMFPYLKADLNSGILLETVNRFLKKTRLKFT
jgi:formate C-acetyltransferase